MSISRRMDKKALVHTCSDSSATPSFPSQPEGKIGQTQGTGGHLQSPAHAEGVGDRQKLCAILDKMHRSLRYERRGKGVGRLHHAHRRHRRRGAIPDLEGRIRGSIRIADMIAQYLIVSVHVEDPAEKRL